MNFSGELAGIVYRIYLVGSLKKLLKMTELTFYKWIVENNPEWKWTSRGEIDDVIIWINSFALTSFLKLFPTSSFDEGGIEVRLQKEGVAIWASDLLDPLGIAIENIFEKELTV